MGPVDRGKVQADAIAAWLMQSQHVFAPRPVTSHRLLEASRRILNVPQAKPGLVKAESMLGQVKAIRESVLPIQQLFSKRILQHNLQTYINGYPYRRFSMYNFFTAMTSANPTEYWARLISQMKFRNTEDYEMLLSRYRVLPLQFEQMIKLMRKAVESGTQQNAISFVCYDHGDFDQ
ncbi:hypothetical protein CAPTEDRAFT_212609 [Capitella teleta]|uniref:Uncharacterized protein n=1 Tax=Capitella teleta TaxID=283909 RepID=R7U279_CAPTE|nr:hypothetical protein CAPTEDRAFT_212609 [Capitella teleta]|eukprot:ELT99987.1 hypothetical protein CAPTEDRAFT_212609 [Capitella teleta]